MKIKNLTDIKKFILSEAFFSIYFWISIAIPYLVYRGLSITEALGVIGFYNIAIVILEYPTGVVGDYYGYKTSVVLGNLMGGLAMLLLMVDSSALYYYVVIIINAIGASLYSGSGDALLKHISNNFKKDYANVKSMADFILFIVASLGTVLATISYMIPLFISAVSLFIAAVIVMSIKDPKNGSRYSKEESNIYREAFEHIKYVSKSKVIILLISATALVTMYAGNLKSITGSLGDLTELPLELVGVTVGMVFLFRSLGKKLAYQIPMSTIGLIGLLFIAILPNIFLQNYIYLVLCLLISAIIFGALIIRVQAILQEIIPDKRQSSILSLQSLLNRLSASVFIVLFGIISTSANIYFALFLFCLTLFIPIILIRLADQQIKDGI